MDCATEDVANPMAMSALVMARTPAARSLMAFRIGCGVAYAAHAKLKTLSNQFAAHLLLA